MSIILGIDPGFRVTGYGLVRQEGYILNYLDSGCIKSKSNDLSSRLKCIYSNISNIIIQFQPDCLAIEQIFVSKNVNSALKLGQAKGVAIIAAMNLNIPVFEYSVSHIKKTIVGIGSAEKNQINQMVRHILMLSENLKEDAADALAVALTQCHTNQNLLK